MLRSSKQSIQVLKKRYLSNGSSLASSQAQRLGKYPIGLQMHGYRVDEVQPIPEFSLIAVKLKHVKTGAEHLHLDTATDTNNVFSIAFKTNPPDASGVPHILEHTTLCGSYKYPVRDPFFKMLNRSLSNFMNAMTGHDYTFYPFATTNAKDFENLMDVYLSSVLEPLLTYEDFMQEGWRLEQSDLSDNKSDITFKGVVYNEMKGQYNNSGYYYYIKFQEAIYSSLNNAGGDPKFITNLQYEDLVDFHSLNYHPSNAKTFTYGPLPLISHLEKLDKTFNSFGKRTSKPIVKESNFTSEQFQEELCIKGPFDSMSGKKIEEQWKASITWNLGNPLDESKQYDIFKWKVLSSLLCDGHNAPFYQELIEKRYGDDFTSNAGLDSTTSLFSFTMGVDNITREQVAGLDAKIEEIFKTRVIPELELNDKSSFHERIEAILHQIELNFKKHKPDFGLGLLNSVVPTWTNGLDPIKSLQVENILNLFKEDYEKNGLQIFKDLLDDTLFNESTKKFKFVMEPEADFADKLALNEEARLKEKVSELSEEDKEIIHKRGVNLAEKQQTNEDVSILPTLTMSDIPRVGESYSLVFSKLETTAKKIQKRIVDSNGLVYMTAAKDISGLPIEYYKYLPLFNSCLTNLAGTTKTPITELETKIQQLTGGVSFSTSASTDPRDISNATLKFIMNGMSFKANSKHVYNLWHEIVTSTKFDPQDSLVLEKLSTLIKNLGLNQMNSIADRGNSYASSHSSSFLTPTKYINNLTGGLAQVDFIRELNKKLEEQGNDFLVNELLPKLKEIRDIIVGGSVDGNPGFEYSLLGDKETVTENEVLVQAFDQSLISSTESLKLDNALSSLISSFQNNKVGIHAGESKNTLIDLPFQVGFASLSKMGAKYDSKDGSVLQVLSQLISFKHLHSVIREANGAYGGGLSYDGLGGILNYYSYRDPNPLKSIQSFKDTPEIVLSKIIDPKDSWNANDLQEAKLAIFQSIDAPSHLASQGTSEFLKGITDEMKQKRREWFLDVTTSDLKDATEKYLVNSANDVSTVIVNKKELGDKNLKEWEIKKMEA
ncbi:presequence protease, mitochondrial [[Candida] anglica]|uniref:Presequence protease, mitochondrial n=1 Tax=[Candida] anglica TaxID=148631 RepID=A0ABP0E9X0_9ASCO